MNDKLYITHLVQLTDTYTLNKDKAANNELKRQMQRRLQTI